MMNDFFCKPKNKEIATKSFAPLDKEVRVIDEQGNALEGVHIATIEGQYLTTTNSEGIARVPNKGSAIQFSHVGKQANCSTFFEIPSILTLSNCVEVLEAVVVDSKPEKSNSNLWFYGLLMLGTGYLMMKKKTKKVNL